MKPVRSALSRIVKPGDRPSEKRRAAGWFTMRFVAETPAGARVVTEVSGGDPGCGETTKMLAEAAMCLAFDDLPEVVGQLTTAVAMGPAPIERLTAAGTQFTFLDTAPDAAPGERVPGP